MKRRCRILAAIAALCLLTGCGNTAAPTLTPTFESVRVEMDVRNVRKDGRINTYTEHITVGETPSTVSLDDHSGGTIGMTLESADPDTQTVVIRADKPLWVNGEETTVVTVGYEKVYAYHYGEDGQGDEIVLQIEPRDLRTPYVTSLTFWDDIAMYYNEGNLLTLYNNAFTTQSQFELTFAGDLSRKVCGTCTVEDDVMTLCETAGLSVVTLRRDHRAKGWRVDAAASAYHPQSQMPEWKNRTLWAFCFSYEYEDSYENNEYRVTDHDGKTILSGNKEDESVLIRPLSPTMLRIHRYQRGVSDKGSTYFLNTATGEYSSGYTDILAATPTCVVYKKESSLVVQELGGEYASYVGIPVNANDVACVLPEGDTLTVFYLDEQQAFRVARWNYKTAQQEAADPLAIAGYTALQDGDEFVTSEDGTTFLPDVGISYSGILEDQTTLYTVGVEHAAIRINGEYVELTHQDWNVQGDEIDGMDFVDPPVTTEELIAQLKADVAAGLATEESCLDGKATVYRYQGEDRFHAVTVAQTVRGRCVYVGDAETALADAAIGLVFAQ